MIESLTHQLRMEMDKLIEREPFLALGLLVVLAAYAVFWVLALMSLVMGNFAGVVIMTIVTVIIGVIIIMAALEVSI